MLRHTPVLSAAATRAVKLTLRFLTTFLLMLSVCLAAVGAVAQQTDQPAKTPDAPSTTKQAQAQTTSDNPLSTGIGFVDVLTRPSLFFPDLATSTKPLSGKQKFELFASQSVSGAAIFGSLFGAGLAQAMNSPEGYGQGGEGYAKRFGSSMARNASSQFFGTWMLATALHQDPRFFVKPTSDLKVAVRYSIRRTFITRDDRNGKEVFNWSGLLGPLAGEALANTYMPPDAATVGKTFERYGTDVAVTAGVNILKQYWPTLIKSLRLPHPDPAAAAPAPSGGSKN